MRCVGYRQVWNYFDGIYNKKEMIEKAIVATDSYARDNPLGSRMRRKAYY